MELLTGVHKIDEVRGANSYIAINDEGAAVIDTGMPGNERRILEYAKSIGVESSRISYIILTHPDIDHSGSVSKLRALTGAKVSIHEADAPRLAGEKKVKEVRGMMSVMFGLMGIFIRYTPTRPDILLKDSDSLLGLAVIHTPGHTAGSVCLHRDNEAIFVGDAVRTSSRGRPRLPPRLMTLNMEQAKDSVRRIATYKYRVLLPGHGRPIIDDASSVMREFVREGFPG